VFSAVEALNTPNIYALTFDLCPSSALAVERCSGLVALR